MIRLTNGNENVLGRVWMNWHQVSLDDGQVVFIDGEQEHRLRGGID